MKRENFNPEGEKITGLSIPADEQDAWRKNFEEAGMSREEIDQRMARPKEARPEERYRAHIPDDDVMGWYDTLRELDIPEEEFDKMLIRMNDTYANLQKPAIIENVIADMETARGIKFAEEQKVKLRGSLSRLFDEERKNGKKRKLIIIDD